MKKPSPSDRSIRAEYEQHGVAQFYIEQGATYRNPHEQAVRNVLRQAAASWRLDLSRVLDLACGSGEVTLALRELGAGQIEGADPYTYRAYAERVGRPAEILSFEQVAAGALAGRSYSLVVCSFAMHLIEPSRLPALAYQLTLSAGALLIVTPHKRPVIRPEWGWELAGELVVDRVRARLYRAGVSSR